MYTIENYEYDCTKKCKCPNHGKIINAALTKRGIPDDKLAAFIAKTCRNFAQVCDFQGRSALHIASSVGRYKILEWLLNHGAIINCKDFESKQTPLHRAIFYGYIDCAVTLIRYGADIKLFDEDCRTPLQNVCLYSKLPYIKDIPENTEVFVWGANKNYNLGVTNKEQSNVPQLVDIFRRKNICIQTISMSAYHSVFLDKHGCIYNVGHGNGGRLGIGSENSLITPSKVRILSKDSDEHIIQVSCSKHHTLLLTNKNSVYTSGVNLHKQLGIKPPPEKLTSFREIPKFFNFTEDENLLGVIAKDQHSIVFTRNAIIAWGTNRGHFPKCDKEYLIIPTVLVRSTRKIHVVDSSPSAIAYYTDDKWIHISYNYKSKSFKAPSLTTVVKISLSEVDKQDAENSIQLVMLTDTNAIYVWCNDIHQCIECTYSIPISLRIDNMIFQRNKVLIVSQGNLYVGKASRVTEVNSLSPSEFKETSKKDILSSKYKIKIDLKRFHGADRVLNVFCDEDLESFAVLQEHSQKYLDVPKCRTGDGLFTSLLNEVNEFDSIHDVVFHVDHHIFPAHKFIVCSRSKGLKKIISNYDDKNIYLNFAGLTGVMFKYILRYIYSNYLITTEDLDEILQSSSGAFTTVDRQDGISILTKIVSLFELQELVRFLESYNSKSNDFPVKFKTSFMRLKRFSLPELHDVTIKCANNKEIYAHKCVLVTRLEYFNVMFNSNWTGEKVINLTSIPLEYVEAMVDYLYTSDADYFRKQDYSETYLCNMIVICDQFFIDNLRRICEILILEKINIKKCGELLEFASSYNCELLEKGCLEYICQNLARVLDQRSLEFCEPETLLKLNLFYQTLFKNKMQFRIITPQVDNIPDTELTEFVSDFAVNLEYKMPNTVESKFKNERKTKHKEKSKKNYEKEAIISLKKLCLDFDENPFTEKKMESQIEALNTQCGGSWERINDKKEMKKQFDPVVLNLNKVMREEKKPEENYTRIGQVIRSASKLQNPETDIVADHSTQTRSIISLADFNFVKSEKRPQKQRKRSSGDSSATKPIDILNCKSPGGSSNSASLTKNLEHSFADIMKSPTFSISTIRPRPRRISFEKSQEEKVKSDEEISPASTPCSSLSSSFTKILADEKKQKDYFEKLKSKSLVLTQLEETAIEELRAFYNVDNVHDEFITIDRRGMTTTMNFAVWNHN